MLVDERRVGWGGVGECRIASRKAGRAIPAKIGSVGTSLQASPPSRGGHGQGTHRLAIHRVWVRVGGVLLGRAARKAGRAVWEDRG